MVEPYIHLAHAGDFVVRAGSTLGPRVIVDYEIVFFPNPSSGRYSIGDVHYALDYPCIILTEPHREHAYQFSADGPTRHQFAHFSMNEAVKQAFSAAPWKDYIRIEGPTMIPMFFGELLGTAASKGPLWRERCGALLLAMLSTLLLAHPGKLSRSSLPAEIQHAQRFIEENLDQPLSVADVAEAVGWSHGHLTRSFQHHLGINPRSFMTRRRIDRACQLLISSTATIKEIAYAVGFTDEHYFSRCFRSYKGIPASIYRERFTDARSVHVVPSVTWHDAPHPLNTFFAT